MSTYEQRRYEKSQRGCGVSDPYEHWAWTPEQWLQGEIEHAKKSGTLREGFDEGQSPESGDAVAG